MRIVRLFREGMTALISNKTRTFLMALGTIVGIGALTVILFISAGTKQQVAEKAERFGARAILIIPAHGAMSQAVGGKSTETKLELADAKAISDQIEGLDGISASASKSQPLKAGSAQTTCLVDAVEANWHRIWDWPVESGTPITQTDVDQLDRVCVLGLTPKKELFGEADPIGTKILIGNVWFTVKGVLASRGITGTGHDRDRRIVIPFSTGMRRLFNQQHISNIRVKVKADYDLDATARSIEALLYQRHHIDPSIETAFTVFSTNSLVKRFKGVSGAVSRLLIALCGLSFVVGGLVLMNIMLISVAERKAEIGVRKALGASRRDIMMQFLMEAVAVNGIGLVLGWCLGMLTAWIIARFTQIAVAPSGLSFVLGGVFSVGVALVFSLQPARQAANLDPVEAIR
ncbi:ABC transporter permease [uncultured Desulfosarcina sp.]|uniref:ABC transporter permease n=1 Tax=uncultured Desulfosarcina sp. TaxID=218289 RepID=UPI0029C748ED|nr:ABC transporter permease [uncultured Desulfosarcina sp.]